MNAPRIANSKDPYARGASSEPGCNCTLSPDHCCTLDCLVQPRFFCGQLLTDADLTAMLHWSEEKFRLARYRHGWGVVSGLGVACDSKTPDSVVVGTGYAVDCCGNDIVLCEPQTVSLAGWCKPPGNACAQPGAKEPEHAALSEWRGLPALAVDGKDVLALDLFASYATEGSQPRPALGRSACSETGLCQDSRTRSIPQIGVYPVAAQGAGADPWTRRYWACLDIVRRSPWQRAGGEKIQEADTAKKRPEYQAEQLARPTANAARDWFAAWVKRNPLHQFCYLWDRICDPNARGFDDERFVTELLFLLVLDCRSSLLATDRVPCADGETWGVPLARVWLRRIPDRNRWICRVLAISDCPPHRRPLSQTSFYAPEGEVNIAPALGQRPTEARARLAGLGLSVTQQRSYSLPDDVATLGRDLEAWQPTVPADKPLELITYDFGTLGSRVVAVESTT